ncbi:MAG: hypothetical protein ACK53Y_26385, partial [bacterium]
MYSQISSGIGVPNPSAFKFASAPESGASTGKGVPLYSTRSSRMIASTSFGERGCSSDTAAFSQRESLSSNSLSRWLKLRGVWRSCSGFRRI